MKKYDVNKKTEPKAKKKAIAEEEVEIKSVETKEGAKKFTYLKKSKKGLLIGIFIAVVLVIGIYLTFDNVKDIVSGDKAAFLASNVATISLKDADGKEVATAPRGIEIKVTSKVISIDEIEYKEIEYEGKKYYVNPSNLVEKQENIVQEKELYVRTYATIYEQVDAAYIASFAHKGEKLEILGFDKVLEDGTVNKYQIKNEKVEGYVRGKYLVLTEEEANALWDEEGTYQRHLKMGEIEGGGRAELLDFFPREKPAFEDNVLPDEVRALYINASAIRNVDKYIEFAKKNNINAFVVDIKDNTMPAYASPVMKEYSPTNYKRAISSYDTYKGYIQKLTDEGFYVIGRITVFKDSYYIADNPEDAIMDSKTNKPFNHNGSHWPSAFRRNVWEFNVQLAIEAVTEMGFHEIQFDYVRFPDRTQNLERQKLINFGNIYGETKSQAIQAFLMYATDELHDVGAYVSADIFGESANNYVTGYGQYWAAVSNVVDVVSGMPYPDHFNPYEYSFKQVVWTIPYDLLKRWGESVMEKQALAPTPANLRTWIQAYDTGKHPATVYGAKKVSDQISGLYDSGLTGGWMTWNSGSNLVKYEQISAAFRKEYNR